MHIAWAAAGPARPGAAGLSEGSRAAHTLAAIHGHAGSWASGQGGLPMDRARTLAVVSAAQLGAGVAGMVIALRRVHP
jgi:hypothetical protein